MKKILLTLGLISSLSTSAVDLIQKNQELGMFAEMGQPISTTFEINVGSPTKFEKGKFYEGFKRKISAYFNHYYVGKTVCVEFAAANLEVGQACTENLAGEYSCEQEQAMSCVRQAKELKVARKQIEIVYDQSSKYEFKNNEIETFVVTVTQQSLDQATSDDVVVEVQAKTNRGNTVRVEEKGDQNVDGKYILKVSAD